MVPHRFFKRLFVILFFTLIIAAIVLRKDIHHQSDQLLRSPRFIYSKSLQQFNQTSGSNKESVKTILAWTTLFTRDFLIYHNSRVLSSSQAFAKCPEKYRNCRWTIEKSQLNTSDAVVFHIFPGDFSFSKLPKYRPAHQQWVFMNLEPPIRFKEGKMATLDGLFNVTATYEDDADIVLPYGYYTKRDRPLKNYLPPAANRTKPIVWMVSRCNTLSRREVYANDLQTYIDVDIFGICGKPAPRKGAPPINIDFRTELAKEYYFYLAFENSNCKDYITEKFWSSLMAGLVPIVRGQFPRYEKHVPPGSFINADAFFSYKDLADYLKYLIYHPEEYNKYFEWRKHYEVHSVAAFANLDIHCQLCKLLHTQDGNARTVYNMSYRYSPEERCFNYHSGLQGHIDFEREKAYRDEFEQFLS